MPPNRFNGMSHLGVGIGLRAPHYKQILAEQPPIDWFEIISENFLVQGSRSQGILDKVLETYPIVQHGVSLYFGSFDDYNPKHLDSIRSLTRKTKTPFLSDHLCWGSVDGHYTHDLLPLPYTWEAVQHTVARIKKVQEFLEIPVAIENISSYMEFQSSEMTEWDFLSEVAERADCGILLDVNNIYVSSSNHGFDPINYLSRIPVERVAQIHLAGHTDRGHYKLDTHDQPICESVWQLYEHAIKAIGPVNTLIEWDAQLPPLAEMQSEIHRAKQIVAKHVKRISV